MVYYTVHSYLLKCNTLHHKMEKNPASVVSFKVVKTVVYQTDYRFLKTRYRYRYQCDVIVRDHPTDLGLCYSDVTGQLAQNTSFKYRPMYRLTSCRPNAFVTSDMILSCHASLHCRGPTQNDVTDGWSAGLRDNMTSGCIDVRWCLRPLVLPPTHISCFEHNVLCALLPFSFSICCQTHDSFALFVAISAISLWSRT